VNGAWSNYDEEAMEWIRVLDDGDSGVSGSDDCGLGVWGLGNFVLEEVGGCERVIASDLGRSLGRRKE
jgi:hypothetical protein